MKRFNSILNSKKGFVLLYAVLIMSMLLALTFSITDITMKERKLSRFGEESSSAFFAAESGMECLLYWDLKDDKSAFRYDATEPGGRDITCNGQTFTVGTTTKTVIKLDFFGSSNSSVIVADKSDENNTSLIAEGYSVIDPDSGDGIERGIRVKYGDAVVDDDENCVFDIALVLDSSGSINAGELSKLKTAAKQIVENNELGEDKFKFTVVDFDSNATLKAELTSNKDDVDNAIDGLTSGGGTNMPGGLIVAKNEFLSANNRIDVNDAAVVITDGVTNTCSSGTGSATACPGGENSQSQAKQIADDLKAQGVYIIAIGVGITSSTYEDYLKGSIASATSSYYAVNNFQKLKQLTENFDCSIFSRDVGKIERVGF